MPNPPLPPEPEKIQLTLTVHNQAQAHELDAAWREIVIGEKLPRSMTLESDLEAIQERARVGLETIERAIRQHPTSGQAGRLVRFLAAIYNGYDYAFDLTDLRTLDTAPLRSAQEPARGLADVQSQLLAEPSISGDKDVALQLDNVGTVVATRELECRGGAPIVVVIGQPQPFPDLLNYYCPFQLRGLGNERIRYAGGVDAVQALELALQMIGAILYTSREAQEKRLTWNGAANLGFPVPSNVTDLIPQSEPGLHPAI